MVLMRGNKVKEKVTPYIDYNLIFIVMFLLAFGLIMLYSVSSYDANITFGDSAYYFKKQLVASILGIGLMAVVAHIPYRFWNRVSFLAYIFSLGMVISVLFLGYEANGATRWIRIFGVSIQVSEIAKVGIIIFLASLIYKMGPTIKNTRNFWIVFVSPIPLSFCVYTITDNLSSAVIIMAIAYIMLFVATPGYARFLLIGLAILAAAVLIVLLAVNADSLGINGSFRFARIQAWLDPEGNASGRGYQTLQALYAIGSGGIFGKGLGQSMQKMGFVPEAQNDMIFSIICEELGLFGAMAVILLFVLLIWRMMIIANNAPDMFGALLVVGVMAHISVQVILNICVVTNTLPNTGITLPFISYGGSAILFLLIEIGIVLSVARSIGK